jgi:hypothetical protein
VLELTGLIEVEKVKVVFIAYPDIGDEDAVIFVSGFVKKN